MSGEAPPATDAWTDALRALALFAVDPPAVGGVALRGRPGPARDAWLAALPQLLPPGAPVLRVPHGVSDGRLVGGLDLTATLAAGRPIQERGLLASADGGVLLLAMAERIAPGDAARIVRALDTGEVRLERDGLQSVMESRFGVVALDEGEPGEAPPAALLDRLAFAVDLSGVGFDDLARAPLPSPASISRARRVLRTIEAEDAVIRLLCEASVLLGIDSLGAVGRALRVARASAALEQGDRPQDGPVRIEEAHAVEAIRLALLPRATRLPASEADQAPPPPDESPSDTDESRAEADEPRDLEPEPERGESDEEREDEARQDLRAEAERAVAAVLASLPRGELERLEARARDSAVGAGGGASFGSPSLRRSGRPVGSRRGRPGAGVRLDLLETLRAAAPWQELRRRERTSGARRAVAEADSRVRRIEIRGDDFRIVKTRPRAETTTIFAVDASGSTALRRLGEAKGAVERLLAESYARRDRVGLVAFRGERSEVLLPPTRSLVRAKRALRGLPGGGGTPLAAGLEAVRSLAERVLREGGRPIAVVLGDGQANVALDGTPGRRRATEDAIAAARRVRRIGLPVLFVDTSTRSREEARVVAEALGARYLLLPGGRAADVAAAVRFAVDDAGGAPERSRDGAARRVG